MRFSSSLDATTPKVRGVPQDLMVPTTFRHYLRPHSAHGGETPVAFAEKAHRGHAPYGLKYIVRKEHNFESGLNL